MKPGLIRSSAAVAAIALATTGCQNLTPAENAGVFGTIGGAAAGAIARASGMSTAQSLATGAAVGAVVAATTYIIAKHQATVRQRQVAEARARAAYAKIVAQRRATAQKKKTSGGTTAQRSTKKVPRYIAVDTVKDNRTAANAKKSVMIWDTQSQQIVGNNVYDVEKTPAIGDTGRFETYSAEYVGAGL
jgi:lipopolysaccharide export LptBFGC system permease protein LptF